MFLHPALAHSHHIYNPVLSHCADLAAGPTKCAGRALALLELRTITAAVVRQFDVEFAEDGTREQWRSTIEETCSSGRGSLMVRLAARKGGSEV
jgi:cytochrome P450